MTLPSLGRARTHCISGRGGNPHQQAGKQGGGSASPDKPMARPGIAASSPHGSSPTRNRKEPQSLSLKSWGWQPARPHGELGLCYELPLAARPRGRNWHIWGSSPSWEAWACAAGESRCAHLDGGSTRVMGAERARARGWAGGAHLDGARTSGQVALTRRGRRGWERAAPHIPWPRVPPQHTLGCFSPAAACVPPAPPHREPRHPDLAQSLVTASPSSGYFQLRLPRWRASGGEPTAGDLGWPLAPQ